MPELPEVETVRRYLGEKLPGKRIESVDVRLPRLVRNRTPEEFARALSGRAFTGAGRKGKYLFLPLDGPESLLVHLRMTGRMIFEETPGPGLPRHTHIVFRLSSGRLSYGDVRTLGCLWIVPTKGPTGIPGYDTLGPDAVSPGFTGEILRAALQRVRKPVKAVLLDQTAVAGIGNIYADEVLFLARVRPDRPSRTVTAEEADSIVRAVKAVMGESLGAGGTTFRDFLNGEGKEGGNVSNLRVYEHEGEPCPVCGTPIELSRVSGRGTRFCPKCQK